MAINKEFYCIFSRKGYTEAMKKKAIEEWVFLFTHNISAGKRIKIMAGGILNNTVITPQVVTFDNRRIPTGVGTSALYYNTTGNTARGACALLYNTTGYYNTASRYLAGYTNTTGNYNTFVGAHSNVSANDLTNATAIGYAATVNASNKVRIGNSSVTVIEGQVAWSSVSDAREKKEIHDITLGLYFITSLRPVEFLMKDGDDRINLGFVAQDIEVLLGENYGILGIGADKDCILSLRYTDFIAPVVKTIQEQQAQIQKLQEKDREISDLKAHVSKYKSQFSQQQAQIEALQKQLETITVALKETRHNLLS